MNPKRNHKQSLFSSGMVFHEKRRLSATEREASWLAKLVFFCRYVSSSVFVYTSGFRNKSLKRRPWTSELERPHLLLAAAQTTKADTVVPTNRLVPQESLNALHGSRKELAFGECVPNAKHPQARGKGKGRYPAAHKPELDGALGGRTSFSIDLRQPLTVFS